ncbi:MAG: Beta-lactamase class C-like and penicillin binding proteins (PBPs) superfamily, partial [uncultured Gemmatimonadaceae bacterium]
AGPAELRAALGDALRRALDAALADSAFPGAYAVVGNRAGVLVEYGVGHLEWPALANGANPAPDGRTLWDLASLTKVVATTSAVAQLVGERKIDLDAPVQRYLPQWTGAGKERVTVRHLLTHSGGLPAWRPLHKEATSAAGALALVFATELDTVPGARYLYSDMGAILLGQVVERVSGEPLDRYLARRLFGPLGMRDTRYRPPAVELARVAPTEYDPWRQRKLRGEVHDENAAALGGVAAHAGLFSTGHDLARFARAYLNGGTLDGARVFDAAVLRQFTARQDSALSHRALGWETPTGQNSAGRLMSRSAFGHTGFTGTSFWVDPGHDLFVILLTNRVNPTRQNTRIGRVRSALADAVTAAARGAAPPPSPSGR